MRPSNFQKLLDAICGPFEQGHEPIMAPIHTIADGEGRHRRKTLNYLDEFPRPENDKRLHIGVAGYFNFDFIARSRPEFVLLVDANSNQARYWKELFSLLAMNNSFSDFATALRERSSTDGFLCKDGSILPLRFPHHDPLKGLETLQNEDVYRYVHQLAQDGRAAFATINLVSESKKAQAIGAGLRDAGYHIDTAYWSNIGSFFSPSRGGKLVSRGEDDMFGHNEAIYAPTGLHYKNKGFYVEDAEDKAQWLGYRSQLERNAMPEDAVPAYEHFLENTSALGGMKTLHVHSHASDKIQHIHKYPLILSEGPLRRLPEQRAERNERIAAFEQEWRRRVEVNPSSSESKTR